MTEGPKPLKLTDTALRDGSQSLLATRVRLEDMLPVAEMMDAVGFWSMEVWGGATFDACLRFLNEDPWERLRAFKKAMPKTKLQMLLRGQVVVGYRHYADDVVKRFVARARANGIDVFRIFDAFNDLRNMETAMKAAKAEGGHVQACFCYTLSPVHSNDGFVGLALEMAQMGADSICIKDMGGLISPYDAFELTKKLKDALSLPVQLHTHYTSGMASAAGLKAAEAGVDVLDTAMSPMALSTSQPATEPMVAMLKGRPRDTGLDLSLLSEISKKLTEVRKKYALFETGFFGVDTNVLLFQVPGGMIFNLISQLREQNAVERLSDVLDEVPRVRKDLGYPPLVTPSSQICGTQAVLNVVLGERYKMVPKEVTAICKGLYGRTPAAIDPEVRKKVIGDDTPIDCRPADLLESEMERAAKELGDLAKCEEDVLSYVLFPQVAAPFFRRRDRTDGLPRETVAVLAVALARVEAEGLSTRPAAPPVSPPPASAAAGTAGRSPRLHASVGDQSFLIETKAADGTARHFALNRVFKVERSKASIGEVLIDDEPYRADVLNLSGGVAKIKLGGHTLEVKLQEAAGTPAAAPAPVALTATAAPTLAVEEEVEVGRAVLAPLPGKILRVEVAVGDRVKAGQELCVLEAMKMQNIIRAQADGVVRHIVVRLGQSVSPGETLMWIE